MRSRIHTEAVNKTGGGDVPEEVAWENYERNREVEQDYSFRGYEEDIRGVKLKWLQRRWEQKKKEHERMPFIKRFFISDVDEFVFLKFILGLPFGVLFGFVLYYSVLSQLEIEPMSLRMQFALGFITFYALGFAWSAGMRCVTLLLVPIMFGSGGRFYLYATLLTILISGPVGSMVSNGHEVFRSLICGFNLIKNQTKISLTVNLVPLLDVLITLVKNQDEFLTEVSKLGDQLKDFLDSMLFPDLEEVVDIRVDESAGQSFESLGDQTNDEIQFSEEMHKKRLLAERVDAFYEVVRVKCQAMMDWAENTCNQLWMQMFQICCVLLCVFFWVCFVIMCMKRCNVSEMPKAYLGFDCSDVGKGQTGDEYYEQILRLRKMVDEFFTKFEAKFQYVEPEKDEDEVVMRVTSEQVEAVVAHAFAFKNLVIEFASKTLTRCMPFLFVVVLYQSQDYLDRFITDITFDNKYITSYFVHIDNRRKLMMKRFLLPLKKMELSEITELFNHRLTKKDVMIFATSVSWILTITIYFTLAFVIDYCFASLLHLFRLYGAIDFVHKGHHEFSMTVGGDGLVAKALKIFTRGFNQRRSLHVETTNRVCLPVPTFTSTRSYFEVYALIAVIVGFYFVEPHIKKYRNVIAGFIFRKRQKKRIIYLYNDMLRRRAGYVHQARHRVRRSIQNNIFTMPIGFFLALRYAFPGYFEWLLYFGLGKQQCIICREDENKMFRHCPTFLCRATYCSTCWIDIGFRCYACRDDDDWSVSSGGDTIEDREADN